MQIVLEVVFEVINIFLVLDFNHSLVVILVNGLDFKLTVWAEYKLLIVPKIRVEHWIILVHRVNLQLQLNPVRRDSLLPSLLLVLGFIKDTVILVKNRRTHLALLYQLGLHVMIQLNLSHKRISIHRHEVHVHVQHVLF